MDTTPKEGHEHEAPEIFSSWDSQVKELKTLHAELTDEDLKFEAGKENELLRRVQSRLSKGRDEVISIIRKTQTEKSRE